jgi:hypothetical protein
MATHPGIETLQGNASFQVKVRRTQDVPRGSLFPVVTTVYPRPQHRVENLDGYLRLSVAPEMKGLRDLV